RGILPVQRADGIKVAGFGLSHGLPRAAAVGTPNNPAARSYRPAELAGVAGEGDRAQVFASVIWNGLPIAAAVVRSQYRPSNADHHRISFIANKHIREIYVRRRVLPLPCKSPVA